MRRLGMMVALWLLVLPASAQEEADAPDPRVEKRKLL